MLASINKVCNRVAINVEPSNKVGCSISGGFDMLRLATFILIATLPACTSVTTLGNVHEGSADFRVVSDAKVAANPTTPIPLGQINRFSTHPTTNSNENRIFFENKDYIQITLKTGQIRWFSEGVEQRIFNGFASLASPSKMKGEIAIIANVSDTRWNPTGRDKDGQLEGRVVYYSNDVHMGQTINGFNVPVYGPVEYKGGPLIFDLWVVELDRAESDQMEAILGTLVDLSKKSPIGTIPGVDILNQIGTSFLKSNEDDIIGHITIVFVPPKPGTKLTDPILEVSDVIITRKSDRQKSFPFDQCKYTPTSGEMSCSDPKPMEANNFVFSIRKAAPGVDISSTLTLAELNNQLSNVKEYAKLEGVLTGFVDAASGSNRYRSSLHSLDEAIKADTIEAVRRLRADEVLKALQCAVIAQSAPPNDGAMEAKANAACGPRA